MSFPVSGRGGVAVELIGKYRCAGAYRNLDTGRAKPTVPVAGAGWGSFDIHFFHSPMISLFYLPLSGRRHDID